MIQIDKYKCDFCGTCVSVCPHDAIELSETTLEIDPVTCTECMNCVKACPLHVLSEEPVHAE
ncbi:4Fe-4S binding protein [candidate division KSB1 bacterium]|nr:4Fe-4S binding protein [candidate division KSB1 bacterium]